jgi:hypothetical protein
MIVGDPSRFAIESSITEFCGNPLSQIGLGFFVVHVRGQSYGIRDPNATMLGLPLQTVSEFIAQRGTRRFPVGEEPDGRLLAGSIQASMNPDRQHELFFGMTAERLDDLVGSLDWHPGGDEAFDDSSHIFHFDVGYSVRIIAFKNLDYKISCASDLWVDADEFYGILKNWKQAFETQIASRKIG